MTMPWTSGVIRIGWTLVALTLSYLRLRGVMDNRFQALAHLVTGMWLGAWAFGLTTQHRYDITDRHFGFPQSLGASYYGWLAFLVSLIETYAFLMGIGKIDGH
jgi:hypothetical protein